MYHSQLYRPDVIAVAAVPSTLEPASQAGIDGHDTDRDRMVWAAEIQKFIEEGKAIFHDAKALGGTIGVSCNMCHPDASNTHPAISPNYQVQRQRVALLRDMISWGLENPVKEVLFDDGAHRLRALEACHLAQGAGMTIELAMAHRAAFAKCFWWTHRMDSASIPPPPCWGIRKDPRGGSSRPHGALTADASVQGAPVVPWCFWRLALAWQRRTRDSWPGRGGSDGLTPSPDLGMTRAIGDRSVSDYAGPLSYPGCRPGS
jgi:hypothetical protein